MFTVSNKFLYILEHYSNKDCAVLTYGFASNFKLTEPRCRNNIIDKVADCNQAAVKFKIKNTYLMLVKSFTEIRCGGYEDISFVKPK